MEVVVGTTSWLIGKVVHKLSDNLVKEYVASSELGLNYDQITTKLDYMQGLLDASQEKDLSRHLGLRRLLERLSKKADEAEDVLDELHYFMIQDQLDGTQYAAPDLGDDLHAQVQHGRHVVRHAIGNCLQCFSCSCTQDDDDCAATAVTRDLENATKSNISNSGGHVDKLPFNRVAMSIKIKSVIEDIHSLCDPVSDLLNKIPGNSTTITPKRPLIGSTVVQDKLYGRDVIFEKTIEDITTSTYLGKTLSVHPIVGPGGIGKTTFTQHLYNDEKIKDHFTVRVWICVSTDFNVLQLTQQIYNCIPATEKEESNIACETTNLDQLQISIAQRLKSKRFLIVLDDIWRCDTEAEWKSLLVPFTKGEAKGSTVLVTTRFPKIAEKVIKETTPINLQGLAPKEFWEFFQECVFGENKHNQQYSELLDIGKEIAKKLKCSPLAAKTVGRLLKKDLSWEHWRKVLENNEWKNQMNSDDIMPALKISYDFLPFHLKKCFSYCALFPEDHRFSSLKMTYFWTAIGITDSSSTTDNNYIAELVDNGFLMKVGQCYVMHDLLHELSRSVSSQECYNISSLNFSADDIQQSVRHLSITMEHGYSEKFSEEMLKLKSRINIANLRTLMIFKGYKKRNAQILEETFKEIKGLHVLFLEVKSEECFPHNFSKLIHLRYLRISSPYGLEVTLPSALSRFYHLKFLELQSWYGSYNFPKDISRLKNLCHFIGNGALHSNVPEVGKMKNLRELKIFCVKKESAGFELEQLGKLTNLEGELSVYNLEKVTTKEEANEAKLTLKRNLKKLELVWGEEQSTVAADVVDGLQPHDNLRELAIIGHGGAVGPSWLCHDITIKNLGSLTLIGVSWVSLPSFGQLPYLKELRLKNIDRVHIIGPDFGTDIGKSFIYLKEVVFDNMPNLEKWVVESSCHLFPVLESIKCTDCPNFLSLPFLSECSGPCTQDVHYPSLRTLKIHKCPKVSLPPMPHTSTLTGVTLSDGSGLVFYENNWLNLSSYCGALAFHNLGKVKSMHIGNGSRFPWACLQTLTSLRKLSIERQSNIQSMAQLSNLTSFTRLELVDCENLTVDGFDPLITVNLKELLVSNPLNGPRSIAADLLSKVAMTKLMPEGCFQLEQLKVDCIRAVLVAPICILLAATLHTLEFWHDQRVESFTEEEEQALQLLTSLQRLQFCWCPGLLSLPAGLHSLSSLRVLDVIACPEIRSLPMGGLPTALQELALASCSDELQEQVKEFKLANPHVKVQVNEFERASPDVMEPCF